MTVILASDWHSKFWFYLTKSLIYLYTFPILSFPVRWVSEGTKIGGTAKKKSKSVADDKPPQPLGM